MPMNRAHRTLCGSHEWAAFTRRRLLPWALEGVGLGEDVLEVGPGYGANLRVLVERVSRLTALEIDGATARRLERDWGTRALIVHGDATAAPLPDAGFSAVVCFTMLHHVPTVVLQDRLLAEAYRMLRPGGVFAGSDSQLTLPFRLLHLGDTMNVVCPQDLGERLAAAGFDKAVVERDHRGHQLRFRAHKA
ncbi:class I SAM-dependent methyltransferase [Streptomyces fulvorobeus]|uniref:SAM-dependent methyltransferase n=1 Tax=Streptomyces fulvorobeus TaxID=284028 RepID=A0A7Y9KVL6_9ACTN|nr:class I SAM-dependent methyltransferase [Streptomyces fulvorobeus]NYE39852.1 SAM-dependent methyltransferase [Streptomyces fulvorobeus]